MPWPNPSQYNNALQTPHLFLADKELKSGEPELDGMGLPRPASGTFASVYSLRYGKQRWAVRCFLKDLPDNKARYKAIDAHLRGLRLPCTVGFEYQEKGILVEGDWYPLVKMEWVDGVSLNRYIETNLHRPTVLAALAENWISLLGSLKQAGIAHGDLQHGNVLVSGDTLRLVDYDGMYVPELMGRGSNESGHPAYQHPQRRRTHYDETIDRFSAVAIYVAIQATRLRPRLWQEFNDDDNLLFNRPDFEAPGRSPLFAALAELKDKDLRQYIAALREACDGPVEQVPDILIHQKATIADSPLVSSGIPSWLTDYAVSPLIKTAVVTLVTKHLTSAPATSSKPSTEQKKPRRILHRNFGEGIIIDVETSNNKKFITVQFDSGETKKVMASHEAITYLKTDGTPALRTSVAQKTTTSKIRC